MIHTPNRPRSVRRLVVAGLLAALATSSSASLASAQETATVPPRQIIVSGTGEASGKPDLAITGLTVLRTAPTAGAAMQDANKAMNDVIEAMKTLGVEARDLQTSGFQISPQYVYDNNQNGTQVPPKLVGYEVRNTVSVRIRDLSAVGALLDRAVSLGVNEGNGIVFTIDDPSPLRGQAQRKAVEDASRTAKILADAAGVALGSVVSIDAVGDTTGPLPPPMPMQRMLQSAAKSGADMQVEAGENTVTSTVRVVFSIASGS